MRRLYKFCGNEESTKTSLILPLFRLLGYNVDSPREVRAECGKGPGGDKYHRRVDWAFYIDDMLAFLVEAKAVGENIAARDPFQQLSLYYSQRQMSKPQKNLLGILTSGVRWRFFTDLNVNHLMDKEPFLDWNVLEHPIPCDYLAVLQRDAFNPERIKEIARPERRRDWMKDSLLGLLRPSASFVRLAIQQGIEDREATDSVVEEWRPIVASALQQWANQQVRTVADGKVAASLPPADSTLAGSKLLEADVTQILYCRGDDADAAGTVVKDSFLVKKGSTIRLKVAPSAINTVGRKRNELIAQGALVMEGANLRFARDYVFPSASSAASCVLGRSANGLIEWENEEGISLRDILSADAEPFATSEQMAAGSGRMSVADENGPLEPASGEAASRDDEDAESPNRRVSLKEIIESGELVPGRLTARFHDTDFEADLLATGVVVFQGVKFDNPSLAGKAAKRTVVPDNKKVETAGLDFWRYQDKNGNWVPLKQPREDYLAHHPERR